MRIYKINRADIIKAAEGICRVEVDYLNPSRGGGFTFAVKCYPPTDIHPNLYRRISAQERRVNALCWHGFRDFFTRLFDLNPDAVVVTALARYDGRDGFEHEYPKTASFNIGSRFCPLPIAEACTCRMSTPATEKLDAKLGPPVYPEV